MVNHLRIDTHKLSRGENGISVHEEEREEECLNADLRDMTLKSLRRIMNRLKLNDIDTSLTNWRSILDQKNRDGIADIFNFRRDDLKRRQKSLLMNHLMKRIETRLLHY